jgi:hypothetical protein
LAYNCGDLNVQSKLKLPTKVHKTVMVISRSTSKQSNHAGQVLDGFRLYQLYAIYNIWTK